jgi:hypothetical protein
MEWKCIDFQGIVNLNETVVEQLYQYLEEKEAYTSQKILHSIESFENEASFPALVISKSKINLADAIENLSKKIRLSSQMKQFISLPLDWKEAGKKNNEAAWDYLETLQESVTELFQQVDQVQIENWQPKLIHAVDLIKELIMRHLDDLKWALKRLENLLWDYRSLCESQESKWDYVQKILFFWKKIIDRKLFSSLDKSKKELGFRYQKFSDRYERYIILQSKIDHLVGKFKNYTLFNSLDSEVQEKITKSYRLIKFWELNLKTRSLPQRDSVRSLRQLLNPEKILEASHIYFKALKNGIFEKSKEIKIRQSENEEKGTEKIQEFLKGYQSELHTLGSLLTKYRVFLLKTDPNPYVRSRLGFPEWFLGPEPIQTKKILVLTNEFQELDEIILDFKKTLETKEDLSRKKYAAMKKEILETLHNMGQPLTSKAVMKGRAEYFIHLVANLNELGTTRRDVVEFVGEALGKGLRNDWKYHVLFDHSLFHQLYSVHINLVGPIEDRSHLTRMQKFKRLIQQIEQWIKNNDTPRHTHEIELDMNDLKVYLQDFLAHVQRICYQDFQDPKNKLAVRDVEVQLLEYRYLFGNFFHHLRENKAEERMIRNQFLFVDQYFETIENKLHDWKES